MQVVIHFKGGLGNQLIQYAFVQKYFAQQKAAIVFDTTHFRFIGERQFFLGDFPQASPSLLKRCFLLIGMYYRILLSHLYKRSKLAFLRGGLSNYIDDEFDISTLATTGKRTFYVNGYFQHLELFPFPPDHPFHDFLNQLGDGLAENTTYQSIKNADNPVMLHLRRGDYVQNEVVKKNMGTCGLAYFQKGLETVGSPAEKSTLFVFSDDPGYATELFKGLGTVHIVKGDTANPITDFLLMRCFRYAVISNSTLSYMANMFSLYADNIVVMPRPWFENQMQFKLGMKENWCYVDKVQ